MKTSEKTRKIEIQRKKREKLKSREKIIKNIKKNE